MKVPNADEVLLKYMSSFETCLKCVWWIVKLFEWKEGRWSNSQTNAWMYLILLKWNEKRERSYESINAWAHDWINLNELINRLWMSGWIYQELYGWRDRLIQIAATR